MGKDTLEEIAEQAKKDGKSDELQALLTFTLLTFLPVSNVVLAGRLILSAFDASIKLAGIIQIVPAW